VNGTCDHRWLRLPIVDFSATYRCQTCAWALRVSWIAVADRTLDDLDRAFEAVHGGTVAGSAPMPALEQETAWLEYLTGSGPPSAGTGAVT
jgi:hypothetical protein